MSPSFSEELAWPEDAIEVGLIVDAWGIKGAMKVVPFSGDPQALFSSKRWYLRAPDGRPATAPRLPRLLKVTSARPHGDVIVAMAQEVEDRNAAEALAGTRVFVSRASFPTTGKDEFYWVDLIGLDVVNRGGEPLGKVVDLMDSGAQTVMRALSEPEADGGTAVERLIPFVSAYVDDVDLERRRILVDWELDY